FAVALRDYGWIIAETGCRVPRWVWNKATLGEQKAYIIETMKVLRSTARANGAPGRSPTLSPWRLPIRCLVQRARRSAAPQRRVLGCRAGS
ncbi:hypothetical protein, partial [Escherichia coli]|uniref:hypothetical protein n=1 Tax=Escherichia coli TaxID=562 RepID=UPI001A7E0A47